MVSATKVSCGAPDRKYSNTYVIPAMILVLYFWAAILKLVKIKPRLFVQDHSVVFWVMWSIFP